MNNQKDIIIAAIADYMPRVKIASLSGLDYRPYVYFKTGEIKLIMQHEIAPEGFCVWNGDRVSYPHYDALFGVLTRLTMRCPML